MGRSPRTGAYREHCAGHWLAHGPINHHWTKNLIASPNGSTLFVTVGSNSNVAERGMAAEAGRAAIWKVNAATGSHSLLPPACAAPTAKPTAGQWCGA